LEAVAELPTSELKEALAALRRAEFLHEQAIYPVVEYAFKHPLTQEVALGSQLKERRRAVHAAVAEALQASGGNLDELAGAIAQHWEEAQDRAAAARWYGRAAEWVGRSSIREGLAHWRRVRGLAPYVDAAAERDALALRACVNIFNGSWRAGGTDQEIQAVFDEGHELAERLDDQRVRAMLICNYGLNRLVVGGSADDLVRYSKEAAGIAEEIADPGFRAAIWTRAAWGEFCSGEPHACLRWSARILDEVSHGNRVGIDYFGESPRAIAQNNRAWSLLMLGQLAEAEMNFNESVRSAQDADNPELGNFALTGLIWLGFVKGGDPASMDQARRAMKLAEAEDNDGARVYAFAGLGVAHLQNGEFEAARDACRASLTIADNLRTGRHWRPLALAVMSYAHGAIGETAEAVAAAREAVEFADAGGLHYFGGCARIALAAALTQVEGPLPLTQIDAELDRVEHLARTADIRSFMPPIHEIRARAAARAGDEAATERLLHEALEGFRKIGATGHVARLTTELEA
ncbi:MAG: hypothetical protein OEU93_18705, partial [Rubrivivax sp.]|nr:hypothetical protein [Rubrivivax sp.]